MQTLRSLLVKFRALRISLSLKFVIGVAVTLVIAMGISLYFIDRNHKKLVMEQVDMQAKALFKQIVITRKWVADHSGVFVERLPWKEPSPYLNDPEIIDDSGKKYIKESPAMVTKELSQYAKDEGIYWFHITSLKLINPENAPDEFETVALKEFETERTKEYSKIEKHGQSYLYRYIAPLYIEEACLKCHSHQNYKIGDVRGAISVSVPMDYALRMIHSGRIGMVMASLATVGILILMLYFMMKELVLRPVMELKTSMKDFSREGKADTSIIKTGDELEDLSNSFSEMSDSLSRYHSGLEDEIKSATHNLEKANTRLTELNEKKSDFIAQISHELRTPMTSIKGAMDYLSVKVPKITNSEEDTRDLMEFLDVISKNADRLIRLVNDTLDIERIEAGMFDLHLIQVDLLALIKEVIISFQSVTAEKNIVFKISARKGIFANADEDRIRQVLINLVSNAINYSPDNSEIECSVTESEDKATVVIKDEGPGIPDKVREKIFDKFYTIGKRHGTGVGLAICKGIIEAHNGEIAVLKDVEKGSAIYFKLPKTGL